MTWITEFGEAYDIPPDVENRLHELGFEDESWHNDTAPIFRKAIGESGEWLVVCEHPDIDRREFSDAKRFTVSVTRRDSMGLNATSRSKRIRSRNCYGSWNTTSLAR